MVMKAHLETPAQSIDGRRQKRLSLHLETSGRLPEGVEANVTVHNISAAGLLFESELSLQLGDALNVDLPEVGPVGLEIVWASGTLYGCAFDQALGEAALAAAQLRGGMVGDKPAVKVPSQEAALQPWGAQGADTLGVRLNRLRRERGLTLAQVAASLGVSKPTVWAWEKGKARPIPERLTAIAKVLGVSATELAETAVQKEGAALVEECRQRIATAYGTQAQRVRIVIEL